MKFTLNWLKDHLETDASLQDICVTLTKIGLEVDEVVNPAERLGDFVIARVLKAEQHPDADKLRVCEVDFGGDKPIQVVCGAPNARTGMVGVFAPEGTYIPGTDMTLGKAKIRGVESSGMLCSERELELSDEHDGIIDLPEDKLSEVGRRYVDVMDLNDPMIEIDITPNRPDCLGIHGIARDLAAAGIGKLKSVSTGFDDATAKEDGSISVTLNFPKGEEDACPVFAGRLIKGVKNGPSPAWLQQRLRAIGLRPINALVDITNYVSYDRARPLHVFDADKLNGNIQARLGKKGDKFLALDGKEYEADETMTVIADDQSALAFGGIMGGESSGCTEETTNVFIESAYFDPIRTALTGRKTNIISDARYRNERGIDPLSEEEGVNLGTELALEFCGGTPTKMVKAGKEPDTDNLIEFDPMIVTRLTGLTVDAGTVSRILNDLGFKIEGKGSKLKAHAPSWRPDINGAADLVEEVIRIIGIDEVPSVAMDMGGDVFRPVLTDMQKRMRKARRTLAGRGQIEAVNWSFIGKSDAEAFGGGQPELELSNPMSSELSFMRPSLLAGLMQAGQRNRDRGTSDLALFEVGQCYRGENPEDQWIAAAGVRFGTANLASKGRDWAGNAPAVDVFDAKADAEATLSALGLDTSKVQITRDAPDWFHPGRSGTFRLGPKIVLAHFGELHPAVLEEMDIPGPIVAFEIDLSAFPASRKKDGAARPALEASDLQPVRRDFAFTLARDATASDVVKSAMSADKNLITAVNVFDVYEGDRIDADKKSLAIEVTIQPKAKTLTDEEIEKISSAIIAKVTKATGAELRS